MFGRRVAAAIANQKGYSNRHPRRPCDAPSVDPATNAPSWRDAEAAAQPAGAGYGGIVGAPGGDRVTL